MMNRDHGSSYKYLRFPDGPRLFEGQGQPILSSVSKKSKVPFFLPKYPLNFAFLPCINMGICLFDGTLIWEVRMRLRSTFFLVFLVSLVVVPACSESRSFLREGYDIRRIRSVAAVEVEGAKNETIGEQIADMFAMEMHKKGYRSQAWHQVRTRLQRQDLINSDLPRRKRLRKMGNVLHVDALATIHVYRAGGGSYDMSIKLFDAQSGKLVWTAGGSGERQSQSMSRGGRRTHSHHGSTDKQNGEQQRLTTAQRNQIERSIKQLLYELPDRR